MSSSLREASQPPGWPTPAWETGQQSCELYALWGIMTAIGVHLPCGELQPPAANTHSWPPSSHTPHTLAQQSGVGVAGLAPSPCAWGALERAFSLPAAAPTFPLFGAFREMTGPTHNVSACACFRPQWAPCFLKSSSDSTRSPSCFPTQFDLEGRSDSGLDPLSSQLALIAVAMIS